LLIIATPIEISLIAVAYDKQATTSKVSLYPTDISVTSDSVSMTSIVGSESGRIFMCGNNGRVYELSYKVNLNEGTFFKYLTILYV
jgi:nuclear pore complex protein Nup155